MKTPVQKLCAAALVAAALTAGAVSVNAQAVTNLTIQNNSFETPSGTSTFLGNGANNTNYVTGWTGSTTGQLVTVVPGPVTNQSGSQVIEFFAYPPQGWTGGASLYQTLSNSYVAGDTYTLTAWAGADVSNHAQQTNDFFFLGTTPTSILSSTVIPGGFLGSNTLIQYTVTYTASTNDAGQPIVLGFDSATQGTAPVGGAHSYMAIDNFAITQTTPVPEPAGVALAAFGGLALVLAYRRRRSA